MATGLASVHDETSNSELRHSQSLIQPLIQPSVQVKRFNGTHLLQLDSLPAQWDDLRAAIFDAAFTLPHWLQIMVARVVCTQFDAAAFLEADDFELDLDDDVQEVKGQEVKGQEVKGQEVKGQEDNGQEVKGQEDKGQEDEDEEEQAEQTQDEYDKYENAQIANDSQTVTTQKQWQEIVQRANAAHDAGYHAVVIVAVGARTVTPTDIRSFGGRPCIAASLFAKQVPYAAFCCALYPLKKGNLHVRGCFVPFVTGLYLDGITSQQPFDVRIGKVRWRSTKVGKDADWSTFTEADSGWMVRFTTTPLPAMSCNTQQIVVTCSRRAPDQESFASRGAAVELHFHWERTSNKEQARQLSYGKVSWLQDAMSTQSIGVISGMLVLKDPYETDAIVL
jgi:hypothetical protein